MKRARSPAILRDLDFLYRSGSVGGLSDRELLGQFKTSDRATAERAFEALVGRHGPMVLGVCRRILGDRLDAEDAFQATFLLLGMSPVAIRKPDSLGPRLHGVAARISRRARIAAERRKHQALSLNEMASCASPVANDELSELW